VAVFDGRRIAGVDAFELLVPAEPCALEEGEVEVDVEAAGAGLIGVEPFDVLEPAVLRTPAGIDAAIIGTEAFELVVRALCLAVVSTGNPSRSV
jgi:hypothetical protein